MKYTKGKNNRLINKAPEMYEALNSELRWLVSVNDRMEGITKTLFNDRIIKLQSILKEIES